MPWRRGGLCAALVLVAAASAHADDRALVLVTARAGAPFAHRLRAEAAQVGISIVDDESASLDEEPAIVCRRNGAVGLIRVWSDTNVALFLPTTGRPSTPVETFSVSPERRDSLALRVIEEIRSRLAAAPEAPPQETAKPVAQEPREGVAAAPAASPATPADTRSPATLPAPPAGAPAAAAPASPATGLTLGLAGGLAGSFSPGGLGTSLQAAVGIAARSSSGFGLALRGALPLIASALNAPEGAVRWQPVLATLEATAEPWRRPSWSAIVGVEAGAMLINLSPAAAPDYRGNPDRMVVAVVLVGAGMRAPLNDWLAVRAGFSAGVAAPRPVVRIDGRDVAHWGRPCAFFTVTTELRLLGSKGWAARP